MVWRENLAVLKANKKVPISPKPERLRPPKLVCMRFTSTSTCMNFLSQFYFLTPMDYSPWFEGKFWLFWRQTKKEQNLRNRRGYAHQNLFACVSHQLLLAWIFWANSIFWPPWTIVHGSKGSFGCFEGKRKRSKISETGEATPTKICLHAFHINFYLHEFFEPILFFDPHGL